MTAGELAASVRMAASTLAVTGITLATSCLTSGRTV